MPRSLPPSHSDAQCIPCKSAKAHLFSPKLKSISLSLAKIRINPSASQVEHPVHSYIAIARQRIFRSLQFSEPFHQLYYQLYHQICTIFAPSVAQRCIQNRFSSESSSEIRQIRYNPFRTVSESLQSPPLRSYTVYFGLRKK